METAPPPGISEGKYKDFEYKFSCPSMRRGAPRTDVGAFAWNGVHVKLTIPFRGEFQNMPLVGTCTHARAPREFRHKNLKKKILDLVPYFQAYFSMNGPIENTRDIHLVIVRDDGHGGDWEQVAVIKNIQISNSES